VIWAPTANSLLEATLNTDFAQADVDRQVVNLTRFSVFLPERRQFFLENADLLNAGGLGAGNIGGIGGISGRYFVQPFFTRKRSSSFPKALMGPVYHERTVPTKSCHVDRDVRHRTSSLLLDTTESV
jgi:hypothetical protein